MADNPLDAMKWRWSYIQGYLFPSMREDNDPITEALGRLVTTLDVIGLEAFVPDPPGGPGRPPEDRRKTSSAPDFSASAARSRSNAISCSASSRSPSIRSSVSSTTGPPPPDLTQPGSPRPAQENSPRSGCSARSSILSDYQWHNLRLRLELPRQWKLRRKLHG